MNSISFSGKLFEFLIKLWAEFVSAGHADLMPEKLARRLKCCGYSEPGGQTGHVKEILRQNVVADYSDIPAGKICWGYWAEILIFNDKKFIFRNTRIKKRCSGIVNKGHGFT